MVDGNNVMHKMPDRSEDRAAVRKLALDVSRMHRTRITIVFDGPPPEGVPDREALGAVHVRYSGARPADDVVVEMLPRGGAARQWTVVTDDNELRSRARSVGANLQSAGDWIAACRRRRRPEEKPDELSPEEIEDWEAYFAAGREES